MIFRTRKLIRPENLNHSGNLFGGVLMSWIDEEAAIYTMCQLGTTRIVTKIMSEINFVSPAKNGDIVEIGVEATKFGRTSMSMKAVVRNKNTGSTICEVHDIVFVSLDEEGKPTPHNKVTIRLD